MGTLFKNSIFNLFGTLISLILGVISIPVIFKFLGSEKFSIISIYLTLIAIGNIADLGVGKAIIKKLNSTISISLKKKYFTSGIFFCFIISLVFVLLNLLILNMITFSNINYYHITKFSLYLIPTLILIIFFKSIIESKNNFFLVNIIRLIFNILLFGFIIFAAYSKFDIIIILSIINLIKLLQLITTFIFSQSIFFGVFFSRKEFYELSISSVKLGVLNFMGTLIGYVDKLILPMILSASIIAPYYLVNDISSKLWLLPGAIFSALFPSLMKFPEKFSNKSFLKKINRILIFSFAPVIIIVSGFSDEIIKILSSGTLDETTSIYLKITLVGVLISCFNQLNSNILIAYNRENEMIKFQTILFFIYLPVLYFSVQYYGLFGACYAFSIRLLIDSVIISILSFKHTKYYFKIESLFVLLSILILVFGVFFRNSIFNTIILIISCFIFIYYLKKSWKKLIISN